MINSYKWYTVFFLSSIPGRLVLVFCSPTLHLLFLCVQVLVCVEDRLTETPVFLSHSPPSLLFCLNPELASVAGVRYASDFPVGSLLSVLYWFLDISFCPLA